MTTFFGCGLMLIVIAGGIYLYYKVERLSREIEQQNIDSTGEPEEQKP